MTRQPVESSSLKSVGHDPASGELHVEFHNGKVYRATEAVAADDHAAFIGSDSIGRHFNELKKRFTFELVPQSDVTTETGNDEGQRG